MAEKEYIEKRKLIEAWEREIADATDLLDAFDFALEDVPAADVAEVVHGEWIIEHGDYGEMMCSVCKKIPPTERKPDPYEDFQLTEFFIESPYCPHCGARMDGGKHG